MKHGPCIILHRSNLCWNVAESKSGIKASGKGKKNRAIRTKGDGRLFHGKQHSASESRAPSTKIWCWLHVMLILASDNVKNKKDQKKSTSDRNTPITKYDLFPKMSAKMTIPSSNKIFGERPSPLVRIVQKFLYCWLWFRPTHRRWQNIFQLHLHKR